MIASTLAFALALSPGAGTYEFLGYAWAPEDMPLPWYMCDEPSDAYQGPVSACGDHPSSRVMHGWCALRST